MGGVWGVWLSLYWRNVLNYTVGGGTHVVPRATLPPSVGTDLDQGFENGPRGIITKGSAVEEGGVVGLTLLCTCVGDNRV